MSQGGYVTLVGFVAQDPQQRETKNGSRVTDLRVGATTRVQDRVTMQWRDGDTSYYNVACWRRLGDHVRASLRKGDPVVIKGRFRARTFEDKTTGLPRTAIDIVADTVGHDLNRGIANYMRPQQQPVTTGTDPGADGSEETADGREMIDEEAIDQFGRELDEGFSEAGLDAPAPRADQAAGAAVSLSTPS
jgi:single-strand DNA-binding protein